MTRYFYTDPLAAAWMAKHFGMRFQWQIEGTIANDEDHGGAGWDLDDQLVEIINRFADRYYLHPDSLHLLEPQNGDLLGTKSTGYGDGYYRHLSDQRLPFDYIILRGGKPFHWPESEP